MVDTRASRKNLFLKIVYHVDPGYISSDFFYRGRGWLSVGVVSQIVERDYVSSNRQL